MDWKRFARRAVNAGVRRGAGYLSRKLADPSTRSAITGLIAGQQPPQILKEYQDRSRAKPGPQPPAADASAAESTRTGGAATRRGSSEYTRAKHAGRTRPKQRFPHRPAGGYPGDYAGPIRPVYTPDLDGQPDPGEIVWGWVPYEEDHSRGKDRPVLVIGRDGRWLLALMLTSKDNVPGAVGEVWADEHARYINIGSGDWDSQRRPSEVRLDRVVRIADDAVRREGAIMPMQLFSLIVSEVRPD